jgi:amidase
MVIGPLLITCFSDCAILQKEPASYSYDHAFIYYWSPEKESKRLRLAVKDLIDIKGVVTTAGSEYVAETSPPATSDAACLAISRARNVQIVGKTNLSEFAVAPSGINDFFGTPRSPLSKNSRLIPGGSSCGGCGRERTGRRGFWNGYGWLYPRSRGLLRHRRFEDHLWSYFVEGCVSH